MNKKTIALKLLLFCAAALVWAATYAQGSTTVSGTVEDKTGPLEGVNVSVTGTTAGTLTGKNGKFSITLLTSDIISQMPTYHFTARATTTVS